MTKPLITKKNMIQMDQTASSIKGVLDDFALAVLLKHSLFVEVVGDMNVEFGNIPKAVKFNVKNVQVSEKVTESVGLSKPVSEINKFLDKLGIKI